MKNLLLFFALIVSFLATAQPRDTGHWSPAGASWIYSAQAIGMELYFQFDYVGDTIIQNLPMKKIEQSTFNFPMPGPGIILPRTANGHINFFYFYQNQDSVFWYDNNTLRLLYVFNTPATGNWTIDENLNYDCITLGFTLPPTDSVIVTNVSNVVYDGQNFELMQLDGYRQNWYLGYQLIKNIGSRSQFFPQPAPPYTCLETNNMGRYEYLECYSDSIRGQITIDSANSGGCARLVLSANKIATENINNNFSIYPNPVTDAFYISHSFRGDNFKLQITDLAGRVHLINNVQNNQSLQIQQLPAGFYVVSLLSANKIIANQKLIKL
jgi:Secretion system C-terminal sorting domain